MPAVPSLADAPPPSAAVLLANPSCLFDRWKERALVGCRSSSATAATAMSSSCGARVRATAGRADCRRAGDSGSTRRETGSGSEASVTDGCDDGSCDDGSCEGACCEGTSSSAGRAVPIASSRGSAASSATCRTPPSATEADSVGCCSRGTSAVAVPTAGCGSSSEATPSV
eukprot:5881294-Prymnesium_polylepis.1